MASPIVLGLVSSFHDLFTAIWIGGLLLMAIILLPLLKNQMQSQMQKHGGESIIGNEMNKNPLLLFQKQLQILVWISMIGLLITGLLLTRANQLRPIPVSESYRILLLIKHIIYGLMIGIALVRGVLFRRALKQGTLGKNKLVFLLVYCNALLGLITVFLSGIMPVLK